MKAGPRLPAALLFRIGSALVLSIAVGLVGCVQSGQPTATGDSQIFTPMPTPAPSSVLEPGVSENQILFGQSAAFTGPAQELGTNMRLGIEAAFRGSI